jgi:hypothetical protein
MLEPKCGRVRDTMGTTAEDILDGSLCGYESSFNWWQEMTD